MTKPIEADGVRSYDAFTLSDRWQVSESTVKRYLRNGKLFGEKLYRNAWYIPSWSVLKFEKRFGVGPKPEPMQAPANSLTGDALTDGAEMISEAEKVLRLLPRNPNPKRVPIEEMKTKRGMRRVRGTAAHEEF